MENRFLDASFFSRLIDSATLEDALKSLGETVYAQWVSGADTGFDRIIDSELLATCNDLAQFVPDKGLLDLCRMPYDFNNVKVILKSLFKVKDSVKDGVKDSSAKEGLKEGGQRRYDLLTKLGAADTDKLVTNLESEEYGFLPYELGDVIRRCWALWDQAKNSQQVENLLDGHMFASMLAVAEKLEMPPVVRWVECKIDAENLRNAVRLQRMNYDTASALPFFHKGGTIRPHDVAKLMGDSLESWGKALSHTGVGAALNTVQDRSDVQTTLSEISKALDEYLIRVLERAKYSASAPENVILYFLRKEEEARNLRIALVCVANGLNREFARRLLSHGR